MQNMPRLWNSTTMLLFSIAGMTAILVAIVTPGFVAMLLAIIGFVLVSLAQFGAGGLSEFKKFNLRYRQYKDLQRVLDNPGLAAHIIVVSWLYRYSTDDERIIHLMTEVPIISNLGEGMPPVTMDVDNLLVCAKDLGIPRQDVIDFVEGINEPTHLIANYHSQSFTLGWGYQDQVVSYIKMQV